MNKYKRADRVAALLQEEVSRFLLFELKKGDLGFITITHVKMSDDLRHARIFYSVLGDQARIEHTAQRLEQLTGMIRGEMGHRLGLRYVPEIQFSYDDSARYAAHIQDVIEKIHREEKS
ncbi:MAG TPA: 30S ribosome-binding factor RbfA [bacterium]|nr:30S ribosome-binding factor RbfA [bacterium]HQG45437.1 30S ribosome-binding factor RbfA [bacterium]HQI48205.1 30S ribosome-binding factor RbfA [bacterium]HQJ64777.1 30S ribosome-binding factor RbfA [bacterium]